MNLTPEQQELGRRNFLRVLAGTPAVAALAAGAYVKGPVRGGPVKVGYIGVGGQGRLLLEQTDPAYAEVRALCDVNPLQLAKAEAVLARKKLPPARPYAEWKDVLEQKDIEAVIVAAPLWLHADIVVAALEAGKHVLCEKMMAWDVEGCERMKAAAEKADKVLEIGYQRTYNPVYKAAYDGIVRAGVLGEMYHARLVWHRNQSWRRKIEEPAPGYDPSRWGYPTLEHLINWRLYWRYSKGLFAELASHQVNIANWFFGATPEAVMSAGGVLRFKDREVYDHVYATFEYPQGRTAIFSSIESNAFEHYYEMYLGTKGTLILRGETEAFLFEEGKRGAPPTGLEVALKGSGPALEASESRVADAAGGSATTQAAGAAPRIERAAAYRLQISGFCSAVRTGAPLACGAERAMHSARACIRANEAVAAKSRLAV